MGRRQHTAAAVRQLTPCKGSLDQHISHADSKVPEWGLSKLEPSHRQQRRQAGDIFDAGMQGQAVLALPLKNADLSIKLPPGLHLAATAAGHLDCRMQLLSLQLDWPPAGPTDTQHPQPRVLPARSSLAGFACRSGALLLAHALFPDHTHHLLTWLAVPVALADSAGVLAAATPAAAQQAVRRRAQGLKGRLQRRRGAGEGVGWVDGVQGALQGSMHTLRSLSGPAAALATGSWLWSLVSPSSHMLCSAVVALLAVAADYNSLGRDVAQGRIPPGKAVEAAWRARHKAAAQRLAVFCSDLPSNPPLAPAIRLAGYCSIAAGLAIDGQGLSGQLPLSMSHPSASALQAGDWPLGRGPRGVGGGSGFAGGCGVGGDGLQLVLAGSVSGWRAQAEVHEAAGLSRAQLLELFAGSSQDTAATAATAPAAAAEAGSALTVTPVPDSGEAGVVVAGLAVPCAPAGGPGVEQAVCLDSRAEGDAAAQLPAAAGAVAAGLAPPQLAAAAAAAGTAQPGRASADSASEKSVDAVIRIKQPAAHAGKPNASCSSSSSSNASRTPRTSSSSGTSSSSAEVVPDAANDPLAFLDTLPLYGQQDHAHLLASEAATAAAAAAAAAAGDADMAAGDALALSAPPADGLPHSGLREGLLLSMRAVYLLLVFAPFLAFGVPMLLMSWWLLTRAAQAQQHSVTPVKTTSTGTSRAHGPTGDLVVLVDPACSSSSSSSRVGRVWSSVRGVVQDPKAAAAQLLQQLWHGTLMLFALLDLLLVLLLGGHWAAGVSAWESAGLWLRKYAWVLLHFSCSYGGAAFIKWGQWSSSRRDIFPADFCDALSTFHDAAPVHSARHSRREIRAALGVDVEQLFAHFDPTPLASGSIAQVHRATLRPVQYKHYIQQRQQQQHGDNNPAYDGGHHGDQTHHHHQQQQQQQGSEVAREGEQVVIKVCHPNVAQHIRLDFKLVGWLSIAASKLPLLHGLPVRESVAQFSHTMTAQTDLRVEAVHALRFHNNFAGVKSSVTIPRPIPGLVSSTVLVESFEAGRSVAAFMKEPAAINTQIVALGVDAYLKMLLTDNFVHTDLHPGNILFRSVPIRQAAHRRQQQQQAYQQQQQRPSLWRRLRRPAAPEAAGTAAAAAAAEAADEEVPQWELELQQLSAQQQQRWVTKHGPSPAPHTSSGQALQDAAAGDSNAPGASSSSSSSGGSEGPEAAQLVLLDFGLAEQLTPQVRHHFISFLNAISAGDGLAAAFHLLRWSGHQMCPDRRAFGSDMVDLFQAACDIHSPAGIDLDYVMQQVLGLARKHSVAIDSCYASLVISVCVLVGFGKALDPQVNLMDAATPTLLAYALTGKVVGRLYS